MSEKIDKITKMQKIKKKTNAVVNAYLSNDILNTDPQGSYTGNPTLEYERPVQDADDL